MVASNEIHEIHHENDLAQNRTVWVGSFYVLLSCSVRSSSECDDLPSSLMLIDSRGAIAHVTNNPSAQINLGYLIQHSPTHALKISLRKHQHTNTRRYSFHSFAHVSQRILSLRGSSFSFDITSTFKSHRRCPRATTSILTIIRSFLLVEIEVSKKKSFSSYLNFYLFIWILSLCSFSL